VKTFKEMFAITGIVSTFVGISVSPLVMMFLMFFAMEDEDQGIKILLGIAILLAAYIVIFIMTSILHQVLRLAPRKASIIIAVIGLVVSIGLMIATMSNQYIVASTTLLIIFLIVLFDKSIYDSLEKWNGKVKVLLGFLPFMVVAMSLLGLLVLRGVMVAFI